MRDRKPAHSKVGVGQKLSESEEASVDPKTVRQLSPTPQKDVEGQRSYDDWIRCPYCSDIAWVEGLSTWRRIIVRCWNSVCGRLFWAPPRAP